jgi:hypothetical protein
MNIYIYKEAANSGLIVIKSATKPASTANVLSVDGQPIPPERKAFVLMETVTDINGCFNSTNKDYKTIRDAMKSCVSDLGGGNVETGFNLLSSNEKTIAATNNIGTGAQIAAAITNLNDRDNASLEYLNKLKSIVRPQRSKQMESKTWSRCKQFLIEIQPSVFATMPEVIYSQITINNPSTNELSGNLLSYYESAGVTGFYTGDQLLGITDYLYSTTGTRFEGAGLVENFATITPDGFNNITEFRDCLADIILLGSLDTVVFE